MNPLLRLRQTRSFRNNGISFVHYMRVLVVLRHLLLHPAKVGEFLHNQKGCWMRLELWTTII